MLRDKNFVIEKYHSFDILVGRLFNTHSTQGFTWVDVPCKKDDIHMP